MASAPLKLRYCDHYSFPLPAGHKFPIAKYRLLREALSGDARFSLEAAQPAPRHAVLRVHGSEYVEGFMQGTLDRQIVRRIGFPWSPELVTRTLASAGGTLAAAQSAVETGFGGTLAGGTHHAFCNEGSGFCVFNDLAIAIGWARAEAGLKKVAVVDLDVHQGDGTAAIFSGDAAVFTFSLHGSRNFPFRKQKSSLDLELPDNTADEAYLDVLAPALERVWDFSPELVLYQAGVDVLSTDRLGRLSMSLAGLKKRDRLVIRQSHDRGVPLVITIGGGYSDPIEDTVAANAQTFRTAAEIYLPDSPPASCQPKLAPDA